MSILEKHAKHASLCLQALSGHFLEADSSRMVIGFYGLSTLDLLRLLDSKTKEADREAWKEWIWAQQICYWHVWNRISIWTVNGLCEDSSAAHPYDQPHIIMTFSALLSLAVLRDDFARLDRDGLRRFLSHTQQSDGSFTVHPHTGESDLRALYCAFVICHLLNDWSPIDVQAAVRIIQQSRTYEGGYGQGPSFEAQGGTTFCALGSLSLCPFAEPLSSEERTHTVRWLCDRQIGGFQGRTGKVEDACYSFWCGASLKILGADDLVNSEANFTFLSACQFKFGGIAKAPDEHPDPFHTYMGLAAMSIYPALGEPNPLQELDVAINATLDTADWARRHLRMTT